MMVFFLNQMRKKSKGTIDILVGNTYKCYLLLDFIEIRRQDACTAYSTHNDNVKQCAHKDVE